MQEAFEFAAAAPFIVMVLALIRYIVPEVRGRLVPLLALALTSAWGLVLVFTARFTGDAAEFVVATVVVTAATVGLSSVASTIAPSGSTVERIT